MGHAFGSAVSCVLVAQQMLGNKGQCELQSSQAVSGALRCHLQAIPAAGRRGGGALHVGMPELGHRHLRVLLTLLTGGFFLPDALGVGGLMLQVTVAVHSGRPRVCAGV